MTERIPICSAKRNNGVFGYIEGSEAFDLLGRPRADYDPKTGLLCDLRDGGVVGYVTLDGKFVGSSRMADELFPKAYEVAPQESPRYYVNNLGIIGGPHAAKQQPAERPDAGFAVSEVKSALPAITIETAVEVSSRYDDGIPRNAELQEPTSNASNRNVTGELVQKLGAEAAGSFSGVFETSGPSNFKQHRVPTTPLSNVVYLSHSESDQPEPQSTVLDSSVAEKLSAQRHAEHVSIPGNNETRLLAPLRPHESRRKPAARTTLAWLGLAHTVGETR